MKRLPHISELKNKPRRGATPETRLKRACTSLMKRFGIFSYPATQGLGSYPGIPDRIAHHGGKVVYLEFKAGKNRLSEKQVAFKERCRVDDIEYHVVRDVSDIEIIFDLPVLFRKGKRHAE